MPNAITPKSIKEKIFNLRGKQVMLDRDLAELYEVETRILNQAVKRNIERFPEEFMFRLTKEEFNNLRLFYSDEENWSSQSVISNNEKMSLRRRPYAFTEQGVAMLSGVLRSDIAIKISIQIMNTFVMMKKFITQNTQLFHKLDDVERKQKMYQIDTNKKFEEVFKAIEDKDIKPNKGIFFNGQVFDAYSFVSKLIRSAKESIILIDNYIDDTVLTLLLKREKNVKVEIFTKNLTKELKLDLIKHNSQYQPIEITEFNNSHDRFLIIDNNQVYHIGASLKDIGKKWFAFSKFDKESLEMIRMLKIT
jgi:hypothetical protein